MLRTSQALRQSGVDAQPWQTSQPSLAGFDLLHLFGSAPEMLPLVRRAQQAAVPVVLSTIAWFSFGGYWRSAASWPGRIAAGGRFLLRKTWSGWPCWRRRLYHEADLLLPNSQAEAEQLVKLFGVGRGKIHVVPNGTDPELSLADPEPFARRVGRRGFVLCAGRIEPRKNQLRLLQALHGSGQHAVILGDPVPGHEDYFAACRRAADRRVQFVPRIAHRDPLLGSAYAAAGCLALCSWFETPGLVALEAGLLGTPLVLTRGGCTREYFGADAQYVDPHNLRDIRTAVSVALRKPRNVQLAERLRHDFSWAAVARATQQAYEKVL